MWISGCRRFNRTRLELKLRWNSRLIKIWKVLIEPDWNWNLTLRYTRMRRPTGFNRTRLELKRHLHIYTVKFLVCFNRTRLELKREGTMRTKLWFIVLIEPDWNWNIAFSYLLCLFQRSFNRTRLELKRFPRINSARMPRCFNRTRLELKLASLPDNEFQQLSFNRTRLELKPNIVKMSFLTARLVLIEPDWNWNAGGGAGPPGHWSVLIEPDWNWNVATRGLHQ